jgi:hypothetical protein
MFIARTPMIDCARGPADLTLTRGIDVSSIRLARLCSRMTRAGVVGGYPSAFAQLTVIVGTIVAIVSAIVLSWRLSPRLYGLAKNMATAGPVTAQFAS